MDSKNKPKKNMTANETAIEVLDDGNLIIYQTRHGCFEARDRDGNGLCTGINKESVIFWGREHLNGLQNSYAITTKTSFVGGYKL